MGNPMINKSFAFMLHAQKLTKQNFLKVCKWRRFKVGSKNDSQSGAGTHLELGHNQIKNLMDFETSHANNICDLQFV